MNSNRPVLSERVIEIILQVVDSIPEIKETVLFGSRALGNARNGSDIDLCVKGEEITTRIISKIDMSLNEETNLPYFFDIVHYETITNEELKKHIDQFGIVICNRPGSYNHYMERKYHTATAGQKSRLKSTVIEILKNTPDVEFAYIFGSFADADLPFRDIDLGVFYAGEERAQMIEAADTLAILLTRKTGYPVDVRMLNSAPVSFVYHVIREELIYERNEDLRCQVVENTIRTYLDIEPILRRATKEAFSS